MGEPLTQATLEGEWMLLNWKLQFLGYFLKDNIHSTATINDQLAISPCT